MDTRPKVVPKHAPEAWWVRLLARQVRCHASVRGDAPRMLHRSVKIVGGWYQAWACWEHVLAHTEDTLESLRQWREKYPVDFYARLLARTQPEWLP